MERVVITGIGVISPIGNNFNDFWEAIKSGKNGIGGITLFDTHRHKVKLAAEVKDFNPEDYMDRKEIRRLDRFSHFALAASKQALADSALNLEKIDLTRAGVIIGSGVGGLYTYEQEIFKLYEKGPDRVSPLMIPMMIADMASGSVAMATGFRGVNYCPVSACASGTHSVGEAFRSIKHGYSDIILTGGAEACITQSGIAAFSNMTALSTSTDANAASLPFDRRRDGFVMGEGSGILVLESLSHAKKRGAKIYAEISGYGATADAYHITSPDPEGKGAAQAMRIAVNEAGLNLTDVGYINAHGTGTPLNDKYETVAIKLLFGEHAYKLAVSSTKSMTGHLLGAAGGIEAIVTAMAVKEDILPPTINLLQPDPELDLDYVPIKARKADIKAALSNSLGFGGHNATILIKKYDNS